MRFMNRRERCSNWPGCGRHLLPETSPARSHGSFHCGEKFICYVCLQQVLLCTGEESRRPYPLIVVQRYENHSCSRRGLPYLGGGFYSVQDWHSDVEKNNIGMQF